MSEPTKRRRRWFSLSLRGLMLLILVIGIPMGWKARRASLQRRAVAKIRRLSGAVDYDWQVNGIFRTKATGPKAPLWLRTIFGGEYFQEVVNVRIPDIELWEVTESERAFEADQLACLDDLDRIEDLWVGYGKLKPEGLARLARKGRIKDLSLLTCPLGDDGLENLGRLGNLESLCIALKPDIDPELAFLDRLPRLSSLQILTAPITDPGLSRIGRLTRLETLFIGNSNLTDASLERLKSLKHLDSLTIMKAPGFTKNGLSHLLNLPGLSSLDLPGTPGTDEELDLLVKLPELNEISLQRGTISDNKINNLKATRPRLRLHLLDDKIQPDPFLE